MTRRKINLLGNSIRHFGTAELVALARHSLPALTEPTAQYDPLALTDLMDLCNCCRQVLSSSETGRHRAEYGRPVGSPLMAAPAAGHARWGAATKGGRVETGLLGPHGFTHDPTRQEYSRGRNWPVGEGCSTRYPLC
jgi:hypothetical protein